MLHLTGLGKCPIAMFFHNSNPPNAPVDPGQKGVRMKRMILGGGTVGFAIIAMTLALPPPVQAMVPDMEIYENDVQHIDAQPAPALEVAAPQGAENLFGLPVAWLDPGGGALTLFTKAPGIAEDTSQPYKVNDFAGSNIQSWYTNFAENGLSTRLTDRNTSFYSGADLGNYLGMSRFDALEVRHPTDEVTSNHSDLEPTPLDLSR